MKFLREVLSSYKRLDPDEDDQDELEDLPPDDEEDLPPEEEDIQPGEEDLPPEEEDLPPEDDEDSFGEDEDISGEGDDQELDQVANKATQDPDKMGLIRTVKGAHLVYKRETEEGTYEELWFYTSGDSMKDELKVRRAIVSGTDIPPTKTSSPDGKQSYTVWTSGNAEMLCIKGLPN